MSGARVCLRPWAQNVSVAPTWKVCCRWEGQEQCQGTQAASVPSRPGPRGRQNASPRAWLPNKSQTRCLAEGISLLFHTHSVDTEGGRREGGGSRTAMVSTSALYQIKHGGLDRTPTQSMAQHPRHTVRGRRVTYLSLYFVEKPRLSTVSVASYESCESSGAI